MELAQKTPSAVSHSDTVLHDAFDHNLAIVLVLCAGDLQHDCPSPRTLRTTSTGQAAFPKATNAACQPAAMAATHGAGTRAGSSTMETCAAATGRFDASSFFMLFFAWR